MTNHSHYNDNSMTSTTSSSRTDDISSSITTGGGIHMEPRVCKNAEYVEAYFENELVPLYESVMGVPMNGIVTQRLRFFVEYYEITPEVVKLALEETAYARWPSPKYLIAILKRCAQDEVQTYSDWRRQKAAYKSQKARFEPTIDW